MSYCNSDAWLWKPTNHALIQPQQSPHVTPYVSTTKRKHSTSKLIPGQFAHRLKCRAVIISSHCAHWPVLQSGKFRSVHYDFTQVNTANLWSSSCNRGQSSSLVTWVEACLSPLRCLCNFVEKWRLCVWALTSTAFYRLCSWCSFQTCAFRSCAGWQWLFRVWCLTCVD